MFSLYMSNVGQDRFEVMRVLTGECQVPFADAKSMLTGARTKVMTAEFAALRKLQERLEAMGAETVIEVPIQRRNDSM
jgi:uncharacterized protein YbjQ (UPF0145 family)